ncbi:inner membrane protein [Escherichia coli]|uniref:Inner membrane protein n=1 Tax=Escherichia coli TaxID=562 RepID=A0A376LKF6_ECOLX|nr:inner membrane protein [Escherichia coli]
MKWQQRVRVATGLSCWQIMLHLLVVALLVVGWMSKTLVHVGVGLCALYWCHGSDDAGVSAPPEQRWREVADVLEELTHDLVFWRSADCAVAVSRVLENNFLLAIAGLAILAGPAVVSLLAKDKKLHHLTSKHRVRR